MDEHLYVFFEPVVDRFELDGDEFGEVIGAVWVAPGCVFERSVPDDEVVARGTWC